MSSPPAKWYISASGSFFLMMQPVWVFLLIAFLALLGDCYTAWRLSSRIKKDSGKSSGKFVSKKGMKIFETIMKISYLVILAALVDKYFICSDNLYAVKVVVGVFGGIQIWSMLENESSGRSPDKKWAKMLQRIMVDKTERHFDVDLHELKDEKQDEKH